MNIAQRRIAHDEPVYIIAELGVNHDGDVRRALDMVDAAAGAGADAIKLQHFRAELLLSAAAHSAQYQINAGEPDPIAMLQRLELDIDALASVCNRAHENGMHTIVTVFSTELVAHAALLPIDAFKTASPDIVHRPLLDSLAATGTPLIVSTGASTMEEVRRAVHWLESVRARLALLQCVSAYPAPMEHAALDGITALQHAFPDLPIGYSDHTAHDNTGALAVQHGAVILEKHFTWSRDATGPDHATSLDPDGLARYVQHARATVRNKPSSTASKTVLLLEHDVRTVSRQSIVTKHCIHAGKCVERSDITFKRPGTGFEPWQIDEVIGRTAAHDMTQDMPITPEDLT